MTAQAHEIMKIRAWLREEAIVSGDPTIYKAFIQRSEESKVWPYCVNGDVLAFAVTVGGKIEIFRARKSLQGIEAKAMNTILANMAAHGYVAAWASKGVMGRAQVWKEVGFTLDEDGFYFERLSGPIDLSKVKGDMTPFEVHFYDRDRGYDRNIKPFATLAGSGKLTELKELHLPERAVAFGKGGSFEHLYVSVTVNGAVLTKKTLRSAPLVHARSVTAAELGVKIDAAGVPYIDVIDLYTPTVI